MNTYEHKTSAQPDDAAPQAPTRRQRDQTRAEARLPKEQAETSAAQRGLPIPTPIKAAMVPVLFFAVISLGQLVVLVPGLQAWARTHPTGGFWVQTAITALPLPLSLLLAWALMRLVERRPLHEIGWRFSQASVPLFALGAVISCAIILAGNAVMPAGLVRHEPAVTDMAGWVIIINGLVLALATQGIPEELLFRGYLMQTLRHRPIAALACSSLVFAAIHLISNGGQQNFAERIWYLALPLGFGFAAGAMLLCFRSLWPAVGIHAGMHFGFLISRFTGLGQGPWIWVSWGLAYVVVGLAALAGWFRRPAEQRHEVVVDR